MVPSSAFVLPVTILRIPWSLCVSFLWAGVVYYVTGLAPQADRYGQAPFKCINLTICAFHLFC